MRRLVQSTVLNEALFGYPGIRSERDNDHCAGALQSPFARAGHGGLTTDIRHWDCGGVTIHANGRRRNDDKGQSATHNANRFSARVSHLEFTLSDLRLHVSRKARLAFRLVPSLS
jgi:hypothetical protein